MVALNQNTIRPISAPSSATTPRKNRYENNRNSTNRIWAYLCVRYYDTHTAEFTSPDPLEYVDGISLFRGYFVGVGVVPHGLLQDVTTIPRRPPIGTPIPPNVGGINQPPTLRPPPTCPPVMPGMSMDPNFYAVVGPEVLRTG